MEMRVISKEKRLCTCCMEVHEVKTVSVDEQMTFKDTKVKYNPTYYYCDLAEEFYVDEELLEKNNILLKDAYREQIGLLTTNEIKAIRAQYGISQKDLTLLLGWGAKTITRYESYQVQDKAHDTILKKLKEDPEWFLSLLNDARCILSPESYKKYYSNGSALYEKDRDFYLRKTIESLYTKFHGQKLLNGNLDLALDKVVDCIRYFASSMDVTNLYKVKLMKLMWYADALSYKKRGISITGLVYQACPMGALPIGHNLIINLNQVPCEEIDFEETIAYYFSLNKRDVSSSLSVEDKEILDIVIQKLGKMSKNEIVSFMHKEKAYIETKPRDVISFDYSRYLQI